jgi:hypothetical protein
MTLILPWNEASIRPGTRQVTGMSADLLPVDVMEWMGMDESMAEFAIDVATTSEIKAGRDTSGD